MKKTFMLIFIAVITAASVTITQAQTTVTIDLSNSALGMERSGAKNIPLSGVPDFSAYTWTCGGSLCIGRTLMTIDLGAIPEGVTITAASLSLYADDQSALGWYGQPTVGDHNGGRIKRIVEAWDANTADWKNKPATTAANSVNIVKSSSDDQDYLNLDITGIIQDMYSAGNNYGILIRMKDESNFYKSLIFGSPLNAHDDFRPVLTVTYNPERLSVPDQDALAFTADVYPNPAVDHLSFDFSNVYTNDQLNLIVFDVNGKQMMNVKEISGDEYSLDVTGLTPGIFFYQVENTTQHTVCNGKFIKQ